MLAIQRSVRFGGRMKCTCCNEEADSVLETQASGVSWLCEDCADSIFVLIVSQGVAENVWQG